MPTQACVIVKEQRRLCVWQWRLAAPRPPENLSIDRAVLLLLLLLLPCIASESFFGLASPSTPH